MINTNLLTKLATDATFTEDAILVDASLIQDVRSLVVHFESHFANWASAMNKKATIIKHGDDEVRIPALLAIPSMDLPQYESKKHLLWFANTGFGLRVLLVVNELMCNPRRAGITRLTDELQVVMSDGCSVLNPGHTMQEATSWVRSQFWDAQDLADFRRETKQQGPNEFEFTWKSFDPIDRTKTNDLEFVTRYKLFDGEDGHYYQLCENLGMRSLPI